MTEDQIKAIAEEYAKWVSDNPKDYPWHSTDAQAVLTFLDEKYCIVERAKVIKEYNLSKSNIEKYDDNKAIRYANCGVLSIMQQLFGTSMFNQNEE